MRKAFYYLTALSLSCGLVFLAGNEMAFVNLFPQKDLCMCGIYACGMCIRAQYVPTCAHVEAREEHRQLHHYLFLKGGVSH